MLLIVITVSTIFPNGVIGYRRLFIDSITHTYKSGEEFQYGKYKMTVVYDETPVSPEIQDCSGLLEGGIFNPKSGEFFAGQASPNYEPKEDCETKNKNEIEKVKDKKIAMISYVIKNTGSDVGYLSSSWLRAYGEDGSRQIETEKQIVVTPKGEIRSKITKNLEHGQSIKSMTIKVQDLAPQAINIK